MMQPARVVPRTTAAGQANLLIPSPPILFGGMWNRPLPAGQPLEDRPAYNGTDDFTNNRNGTPYATRLANLANYTTTSTPVAGYYGSGDATTINPGAPLYIVPQAGHARQKVWLTWDDGTIAWDGTDGGLPGTLTNVPIPVGPAGERFETYYGRPLAGAGPDQQLVVYDPFTDELWEFWLFRWDDTAKQYRCRWAGYMPNASTASGIYPRTWGARATGIPLMVGQITQADYAAGVLRAPLGVAIPVVLPSFIPPATRRDQNITWHNKTNDGRDAVPEGAWFRLPAGYPVPDYKYATRPDKSRMFRMFATAARDYGIVVYDGTGGATSFAYEGSESAGTPYSPYVPAGLPLQPQTGWGGPMWGPDNVLKDFPWRDLVQIKYQP